MMNDKEQNFINKITQAFQTLFLSGLFTIIPLAATVFFIGFAYNFLVRILQPLHQLEPQFLKQIPGSQFIIVTIIILFIGVVLKVFIVNSIVHYFESLIVRIPLIRIIYSAVKTLVDFFKLSESDYSGKKVVLIPYPQKGQYHLAFLLESAEFTYQQLLPETERGKPGEKYYKVFMPNSPNPSSGYFFIMSEYDITHTDISFEEAIKAIVSCGLVTPKSLLDRAKKLT